MQDECKINLCLKTILRVALQRRFRSLNVDWSNESKGDRVFDASCRSTQRPPAVKQVAQTIRSLRQASNDKYIVTDSDICHSTACAGTIPTKPTKERWLC